MRFSLKNISGKYTLWGILGVLVLIPVFVLWPSSLKYETAQAEIAQFDLEVSAEGEVQALEYENINIPSLINKRELRIWYLKISNMVAEGSKVKKGDFVASLDPTDVDMRMKRSIERIDEYSNSLESAVLDSTIILMQKREELINTKDDLTESQIKVEQSKFESKATQRQAKIMLEKAQLDINNKRRNLEKEAQRQKMKVERLERKLEEEQREKKLYEELRKQLQIKSPSSGMVVYGKDGRGRKTKVGDDVGPWMPIIATIPDLNSLVSEAIVKEIDIAKIKVGQKVSIVIDAFPEEEFEGEVMKIANMGQPIKGAGMNGFKVIIDINTNGKKVLPSMTTNNKILIASFSNDVVVPRMAVFNEGSYQVVFLKQGVSVVKKMVEIGGENETHIRITHGLDPGDEVLLSRPEGFN
ncbi:efflux RND transporter periplasmic adaptor subunit [Saccharicrinis sp. 156]|uniref:efflux RND transporter periplasmic adaptor subunit n=1 Tax=Saccharicrinis sp. 156 TaxID=3417574 RepID=UPI003D3450C5